MFIQELQFYFEQEKDAGMLGMALGIFMLALWLLSKGYASRHPIVKGLRYPLLFLSLIGLTSIYKVYHNTQRSYHFTSFYQKSPEVFIAQEAARMESLNAWWGPLNIICAALVVVGLVIVFFQRQNVKTGVGIGLILIGCIGYAADVFEHGNADHYREALAVEQQNKLNKVPNE